MQLYDFVIAQGQVLLTMFLLGLFMGAVYDVLRMFRKLFRVSNIFVQVSDFLYWPVMVLQLWVVQTAVTDGIVRFCHFIFLAIGMALYYIILSKPIFLFIYRPLNFCAKQLERMYRYISRRVDYLLCQMEHRWKKWVHLMKEEKEKKYEAKAAEQQKKSVDQKEKAVDK